ncbi:MAG: RNA methyltransferase [Clostridia bacterium]|nr:RNA methyltransferase [Clostridia bacterium]
MEIINSVNNDLVKRASSLREKKYRRYYGTFLVESFKLVNEVVCGAMELEKLYVEASHLTKYSDLIAKCEPNVVLLSKPAFDKIADTVSSQGVIAEVRMRPTLDFNIDEPFIVLDRIADPGNLGTIIRTAAAVGYNNLVLLNCADPYNPKTVRSSAGGIFYTDFYQLELDELLEECKKTGSKIYIADMNGENVFTMEKPKGNYALVIGNEGSGVCDEISSVADGVISLPMKGQMESLNAGVSASVIMYQLKKDEL